MCRTSQKRVSLILMVSCAIFAASLPQPSQANTQRVLAIGGSVTEIIYGLNAQDQLIGRDSTSIYPEAAKSLPDVGYMRALSAEGVLAVQPDLVIAEKGSGPQATLDVLRQADVRYIEIPAGFSAAAIQTKILAVGKALNLTQAAQSLSAKTLDTLETVKNAIKKEAQPAQRVLFILSQRNGKIMAGGENTAANAIIELAGGRNALSGFTGYKPVTDEAIISAAPDVILMMNRANDHSDNNNALFSHAAIAATPAGEAQRIVKLNGLLLLGFGPRTGEAVKALHQALKETATP